MDERKIPVYFDVQVVDSPIQVISESEPNLNRLKVAVFTKYANRNGSYITDAVAEQLIQSATNGSTPVVGFFDPETKTWASHTGPTLANGYGYVESFLGWEPMTDTDGVVRDYATFSVVLFTDYYEEARNIRGQNQSMELDPNSIEGDWAEINNDYYFVYTKANMLGFCIIGAHEPCFSVSSFFSKNDEQYNSQFEKFESLLLDLKSRVAKLEEGGEKAMDENKEIETVVEEFAAVEEPEVEPVVEEPEVAPAEEFSAEEPTVEEEEVAEPEVNELQVAFDKLNKDYTDLKALYEEVVNSRDELSNEVNNLKTLNESLKASVATYEAAAAKAELDRKNNLVEKYEKILDAEEINVIKDKVNDLSYEELEGKLAIVFAHKKMADEAPAVAKVPLQEPEESQFALLIKKYRKN